MLTRCIAVAALTLGLAPHAGRAATEANFSARTTGDLVETCDPKPDDSMAATSLAFCLGFAQGAVATEMEAEAPSRLGRLFCLPEPRPKRMETVTAFVTWARESPARLAEPPTDGLIRFLHERFPCPAKG